MTDIVLWSLLVFSVAFLVWNALVALTMWWFVRQSLRSLKDTIERKERS